MTASKKQVKANQENARKSTGPKTDAGKAIVALNAMKHGLQRLRAARSGAEVPVPAVVDVTLDHDGRDI